MLIAISCVIIILMCICCYSLGYIHCKNNDEFHRTAWTLRPSADKERIERLEAALESARNGLAWYQDTYPDAVSEVDYEMMEQINVVLKGGAV